MKKFLKSNKKILNKSLFKVYYPLILELEKNNKKILDNKKDNSLIFSFIDLSEKIINENYYLVHYHTIQLFKKLKNNISSPKIRTYFWNLDADIRTNYSYCSHKLGYPSSATYHNVKYFIRSFYDLPFIFQIIFLSVFVCFILLGIGIGIKYSSELIIIIKFLIEFWQSI